MTNPGSYFASHATPSDHRHFPVKTEESLSPDLPPPTGSLQRFQFDFRSPQAPQTELDRHRQSASFNDPAPPVYRFSGDLASFDHTQNTWPSTSRSSQLPSSSANHLTRDASQPSSRAFYHNGLSLATMNAMSFSDEFDDADDLSELPSGIGGLPGSLTQSQLNERAVRRRSSKACDQCRKSKCKCERSHPAEPCRNCVMLGTPCTFLGPSKKRGPPKGYIDAIEARLHQTEALLGIMLASGDNRATGLLEDLKADPMAKEIINRVDRSPYGPTGRKRPGEGQNGRATNSGVQYAQPKTKQMDLGTNGEFASTHPSNEWQDRVAAMLRRSPGPHVEHPSDASDSLLALRYAHPADAPVEQPAPSTSSGRPSLRIVPTASYDSSTSPRRQRRRTDEPGMSAATPYSTVSSASHRRFAQRDDDDEDEASMSSASEGDVNEAVGMLSLNEEEQVRYHGKASGLHLLGTKERIDDRNEGGIWRFPKARVWPPLPSELQVKVPLCGSVPLSDDEHHALLPDLTTQEHLLELYFTYVHPFLPVIHKEAFFEMFRNNDAESPRSPSSGLPAQSASPFSRRHRRVPALLLLAMFSISARYGDTSTLQPPTDEGMMWAAGDDYLDKAKVLLDGIYSSSRPCTCQALLLMGYREVGIGAMAQAWTYIGMAIRMAQDLGMHRSAEGWARARLGGKLFGDRELQERRRIWYACVIMDKYLSTYIGRPLAIFDADFDTNLPSEQDSDEMDIWAPMDLHDPPINDQWEPKPSTSVIRAAPAPGRVISCFNASARLSGLVSMMVQTIYCTRPASSRQDAKKRLEHLLDKWYIELPEHLRYEAGSRKAVPLPHIMTMHLQFWCTVLLLHRPFIGTISRARNRDTDSLSSSSDHTFSKKSYELSAAAANHITSIIGVYMDHHCIRRSSVFLVYYILSASIMHITTLTTYAADPQARLGLQKCMEALKRMEILWPSAGRSLELLRGAKLHMEETDLHHLSSHPERSKRAADTALETEDILDRGHLPASGTAVSGGLRGQGMPLHHYSSNESLGYHGGSPLQSSVASGGPSHSTFFGSYDRWAADDAGPHSPVVDFGGAMSTSGLPHFYSTGLVDNSRGQAAVSAQGPDAGHVRYPQYWNDLSTFSQLSTAYGGYGDSQGAAVRHDIAGQPQPQSSRPPNMYMPNDYNLHGQPRPS